MSAKTDQPQTVLIAAFSGRALAQSARRAGFLPLVVDCFGDEDMAAAAHASLCLPARVQTGFKRKPLIAALEKLTSEAPSPPLGLVLGSGFECDPRMITALGERFRLLGNSPETIRRAKDPADFFSLLTEAGIRHPATRLTAPEQTSGWLMKRRGGSGGLHIHNCPAKPRPDARRYFQERSAGEPVSVLGVISPKGDAFAISRQWTSAQPRRPYRYGGAVSAGDIDADLEARLIEISVTVAKALELQGLVSLDFLVEGEPLLLEVNPRPGATLDVFDDATGSLFRAHILASLGEDAASDLAKRWQPAPAKAAALLYADRGPLTMPDGFEWPDWALDRARAGTRLSKHQPLATVTAEAPTPEAAETLCRERLAALQNMLYEHPDLERETPL